MALGKRNSEKQGELWVSTVELPKSPGHPFYEKLNWLLNQNDFDTFVEKRCRGFYAEKGRPGIAPGIYFRMLLIGFFEGIDSERGIDWRCSDSLSLRSFLGVDLNKSTPDHSTLSVTRKRIDLETHKAVFLWVLKLLTKHGLIRGKTIGIDATTLEANAALRSIVRRDNGETYESFLTDLAKASGIETPTRQDLAKLDRKRKKKGSNKDWMCPHDPDARIAKMKDGRTHLAHKLEQGVDMETGAILGVTIQCADKGDTKTLSQTMEATIDSLYQLHKSKKLRMHLDEEIMDELVTDKGYHSNEILVNVDSIGTKTYIPEPDRGKRNWKDKEEEKRAYLANKERVESKRGKELLVQRGACVERPFAHELETGGMRRTHLRNHSKILKRLLIHIAGYNISLAMRKLFGVGKPRVLQDLQTQISAVQLMIFYLWVASVAVRGKD